MQVTPTAELRKAEGRLPAQSLPNMRPARTPEQAEWEQRIYRRAVAVWDAFCRHMWRILRLPGTVAAAAVSGAPWASWGPEEKAEFERALKWLQQSMMGYGTSPETYAKPTNAVREVSTPLYDGEPILPGELRTAFRAGLDRAAVILDKDADKLLGGKNEAAIEDMLKRGFERLSVNGRAVIGGILHKPGDRMSSVEGILDEAMAEGKNPLVVARELREKFKQCEDYNWARLARTEVSFAQNHAAQAAYEEAGYRLPRRVEGEGAGEYIELPAFHPNCVCGSTIAPDTGWIMPDVATTACEICQAHLREAQMLTNGRVAPEETER